MRSSVVRNLVFVVTALAIIGASLVGIRMRVYADINQRLTLNGNVVPLVQQAHLLQATDPGQQLNLSIGLQLRNLTELDNLLHAIYDPQSARYHHYLTPDEFNALFAPIDEQVFKVVAFIKSQGLTVTGVASNNLLIDATGSIRQVQQAFHTQINDYALGGRTFYANVTAPSVPISLSHLVTSIGGLDNSVQYQPRYHKLDMKVAAMPSGYGPKDLAAAYDATPLQNAGILGDNQTVALFELDGYQQSDVAQYFQTYGLGNPGIMNVLVDGFNGSAGQSAIEPELDIEVVAALAPHARQIVYEGPNTTQGLNDTYNRIVTDHKAQIATTSWGLCETSSPPGELQTLDTIFKQAAAEGISFFAASGDSGAYDCGDSNPAVDSPASDPYITGVGGTNLQLDGSSYSHESAWSNPNAKLRGSNGAGSGGGVSNTFKRPLWQSGPGVENQYSNGFREVPDVTANADPASGYAVYCTVKNAGCLPSGWMTAGGTSAAAPLWAGSMALINQYLKAHNKNRIGFANPALYNLFKGQQSFPALHDITDGNNLLYPATTNYDLASGLGSPDIYNIARDLAVGEGGGTPTGSSVALIENGDFESGPNSWVESSSGGYEVIDPSNVHSGQYSVYFCGYIGCDDRLWQVFTVPTDYTEITITYWWYAGTSETTNQCIDTFASRLKDSSGTRIIRTMQRACNTNVTNGWVQESFDVSDNLASYRGKQVMLFFHATSASGHALTSDFYVDDVVVTAQ